MRYRRVYSGPRGPGRRVLLNPLIVQNLLKRRTCRHFDSHSLEKPLSITPSDLHARRSLFTQGGRVMCSQPRVSSVHRTPPQ